jgi:hypothetical protein
MLLSIGRAVLGCIVGATAVAVVVILTVGICGNTVGAWVRPWLVVGAL